ncbi:unnamed protein product [Amoebophrya sp. A120]|nr:unnamed protein product [Amoebophrya sp. A120]|eukprot:GSA120T00004841001.1
MSIPPEDGGSKPILISLPTNNCARILLFLRLSGLEDQVEIKTPKDFGGLNSPEYRKINPQGKFPALIIPRSEASVESFWFEAQVVLDLLKNKLLAGNPDKIASWNGGAAGSAEQQAKVRLLIQVHDLYLASPNSTQPGSIATQGCLYKGDVPLKERSSRAVELNKQLSVLESLLDESGPYCCGAEITLADLVIYPTFLFLAPLTEAALGWPAGKVWDGRPKLQKWFGNFEKANPEVEGICNDVRGFVQNSFLGSGRIAKIREAVESEEGKALPWM